MQERFCENCKHCEYQKGVFVCTLRDDKPIIYFVASACSDFDSLGVYKKEAK